MNLTFLFDIIRRNISNFLYKHNISKDKIKIILTTYSLYQLKKNTNEKRVIVFFRKGSEDSTGLADRLKAMVTSYIVAQKNNYNLYIYHDQGFQLEEYLQPNEVNWQIDYDDISKGINRFKILWYLDYIPQLDSSINEYHPHRTTDITSNSNINLEEEFSFHRVFWKLFRPSPRFQTLIETTMAECELKSRNFIAVHIRFLDFLELVETKRKTYYTKTGTESEQKEVLLSIQKTLHHLHELHPNESILLFSDSTTFMAQNFPDYIKKLPGKIGHISVHTSDRDVIDKTFIDMFIMAKATCIYNIHGAGIYSSDYSRIAANIGNIPFERITRLPASSPTTD